MESFEQFQSEVKVHSVMVERLHSEAGGVDSGISGFKSDLVKKAHSLKLVWDKFTTRLDDRRAVISLAVGFYDNAEEVSARPRVHTPHTSHSTQVLAQCSHVETSLHSLTPSQVGVAKTKLDHTLKTALTDGEHLLECFQSSPGNQAVNNLVTLLQELEQRTETLHTLIATEDVVARGNDVSTSVARGNGVGRESPSTDTKVNKKYTNLYAELEEQAYKVSHLGSSLFAISSIFLAFLFL